MTFKQKDVRDFITQAPFQPFVFHLADGKSLRVPHPDFAIASPDMAVVARELPGGIPGEVSFVPYEHIVRVEMLPKRRAAKA
jgi:hypothetical protein